MKSDKGTLVVKIKESEPLMVGESEIIVYKHTNNCFKVVIKAPKTIKVLRQKLVERSLQE